MAHRTDLAIEFEKIEEESRFERFFEGEIEVIFHHLKDKNVYKVLFSITLPIAAQNSFILALPPT